MDTSRNIRPPPEALHGPLPDENDPAWSHNATEEHVIPHHPADDSFVSIFNWITKRFNKKTRRSEVTTTDTHATPLARYTRGLSLLNPLQRRDNRKGKSFSAPTITVQLPITESATEALNIQSSAPSSTLAPASHESPDFSPAADYAKMDGAGSSQSNDALIGRLQKVRSFVRQVNDLPWVSDERVTIDYYPGQSKKRPLVQPIQPRALRRHVRSWYSEGTSALLPFTVPPESHDLSQSPPVPVATTPAATAGHEDQLDAGRTGGVHPQGYVSAVQQQELAAQYADLTVHTSDN